MSAPIRAKVEADIQADIAANHAQDLWRLAGTDDIGQLEHILARGVDINARDGHGVTALVRAAYNGRLEMVRALIDHGADLNATREDGVTPLGLAAFFGHTEVVRLLVERGADLGKATRLGTSEEMWATARSFYEIAQYLERERSSAPEASAPQSSANELGVMPSPPENEPADEVSTAETVRAERLTQATSDLTMGTSRITVSDQLTSQHLQENPGPRQENYHASAEPPVVVPERLVSQHSEQNAGTGRENGHASARPVVVRTLKDPPEIWDLVHEAPQDFKPGGAFVTRLTSSKAKLFLLTLAVMLIAALSVFAVMKLRDERKRAGAVAQAQDEPSPGPTVPASQASAPASTLNAPVNDPASAPVNTQLNTQLNTTPGAGSGVDNTPPQQTDPRATDPQPENPASNSNALTDSSQPTGESVNNFSARTASRAGAAAAFSGNKRVRVASRWQNVDKLNRGESETAAGSDTSARPRTPQTADLKNSEKSSSDSASATKRSNTTSSPQSTAPPPTSSTPKAKVIPWP